MATPFPCGMVQGSRMLAIGRSLKVFLLGGVSVLAPSILQGLWVVAIDSLPLHNKYQLFNSSSILV